MKPMHGVVAVVAVAAASWWLMGHPGYETTEQALARLEASQKAAQPALYRWRDDKGVLQITDTAPKGRNYEKVALREDVNIVPMAPEPEPAPAPAQ